MGANIYGVKLCRFSLCPPLSLPILQFKFEKKLCERKIRKINYDFIILSRERIKCFQNLDFTEKYYTILSFLYKKEKQISCAFHFLFKM